MISPKARGKFEFLSILLNGWGIHCNDEGGTDGINESPMAQLRVKKPTEI
jgi:hypothetical protein